MSLRKAAMYMASEGVWVAYLPLAFVFDPLVRCSTSFLMKPTTGRPIRSSDGSGRSIPRPGSSGPVQAGVPMDRMLRKAGSPDGAGGGECSSLTEESGGNIPLTVLVPCSVREEHGHMYGWPTDFPVGQPPRWCHGQGHRSLESSVLVVNDHSLFPWMNIGRSDC